MTVGLLLYIVVPVITDVKNVVSQQHCFSVL